LDSNFWLANLSEWIGVVAVTLILALNRRFKRPSLSFKYPRRESAYALSLYGLILILAFAFYLGAANRLTPGAPALPVDLWQRLFLAGLSLAPFLVALRWRGQPLRSTGWGRAALKPSLYLGLALVFLTLFLRAKLFSLLDGVTSAEGCALLLWLGICLAEESIFRGYIQLRLSARWGERPGWLLAALLYTLWHLPRLWASPATLAANLTLVAIQGLLLGWVAQKGGHLLAPILYRTVSEWIVYGSIG